MKCPECGGENVERDEVDNGVGMQPVGPWGCLDCGWVETWGRSPLEDVFDILDDLDAHQRRDDETMSDEDYERAYGPNALLIRRRLRRAD